MLSERELKELKEISREVNQDLTEAEADDMAVKAKELFQ